MRIAALLAASLVLSAAAHAQAGGADAKPANDTATIHSTCTVDGTQTIRDDFSGSTFVDHSATKKYMLPIEGARARGEWGEVLRLSDMSLKAAPSCFYAYFAKGQAQMSQCRFDDARQTLQLFVARADGLPQYGPLVLVTKNMLDSIRSGTLAAGCQ